jgi:hypothetical protein
MVFIGSDNQTLTLNFRTQRLTASPGTSYYHKASVVAASVANVEISLPDAAPLSGKSSSAAKRGNMQTCDAIRIVPKVDFPINDGEEFDLLEYVTKEMFILRTRPWEETLA